jgi:hypothetical protein
MNKWIQLLAYGMALGATTALGIAGVIPTSVIMLVIGAGLPGIPFALQQKGTSVPPPAPSAPK